MAMAYTPGLKRKEETYVSKERKLPILGEVIVKEGAKVDYNTEVAKTSLPGKVNVINLARILELESTDVALPDESGSFFKQKDHFLALKWSSSTLQVSFYLSVFFFLKPFFRLLFSFLPKILTTSPVSKFIFF